MKTETEVLEQIRDLRKAYAHVLTGEVATVTINAPRALMQLEAETKIAALLWVIDGKYISQLKGSDAGGFR